MRNYCMQEMYVSSSTNQKQEIVQDGAKKKEKKRNQRLKNVFQVCLSISWKFRQHAAVFSDREF